MRYSTNSLEMPVEIREELRGSVHRYKIDYSGVAVKSRCVAEMVNIACIINTL